MYAISCTTGNLEEHFVSEHGFLPTNGREMAVLSSFAEAWELLTVAKLYAEHGLSDLSGREHSMKIVKL